MSFSDDHASPTKPFLGDETGEVFDAPDLVLQSPTTEERVVDTQSGFLVVVRRTDSRLALSVKRRLGTPPTSSLVLTPDESLKLSKILNANESATAISPQFRANAVAANIEDCLETLPENQSAKARKPLSGEQADTKQTAFKQGNGDSELQLPRADWTRLVDSGNKFSAPDRKRVALIAVVAVAAIATVLVATHKNQHMVAKSPINSQMTEQIETEKRVDAFVRNYVSSMLDFSPISYRYSQIQAMASMTPALQERYWKETHFPIAATQLKSVMKRETLLITKIAQQGQPDQAVRKVDVFAELNSPSSKVITPVHLELIVENHGNGQIQVLEQKDITSSTK